MRQIDLFTKRARRPTSPKEFALHCALVDTLKVSMQPGWHYTHIPNGEERTAAAGARLKRMGTKPGYPDFLFTGPYRGVFWLELKREGGTLSRAQLDVRQHLLCCGFNYMVAMDLADAIGALKDLGIVRAQVSV